MPSSFINDVSSSALFFSALKKTNSNLSFFFSIELDREIPLLDYTFRSCELSQAFYFTIRNEE